MRLESVEFPTNSDAILGFVSFPIVSSISAKDLEDILECEKCPKHGDSCSHINKRSFHLLRLMDRDYCDLHDQRIRLNSHPDLQLKQFKLETSRTKYVCYPFKSIKSKISS